VAKIIFEVSIQAIESGELVPMLNTLECKVKAFEPFMRMLEQEAAKRGFQVIWSVSATTRSKDDEAVEIWNCSERVERLRAQGVYILLTCHYKH
jgi:hypothetical protein